MVLHFISAIQEDVLRIDIVESHSCRVMRLERCSNPEGRSSDKNENLKKLDLPNYHAI